MLTPREIRRLRGSLGVTQEQFGQLVHAHAGTVSRWENGTRAPDVWQQHILDCISESVRADPGRAAGVEALIRAGLFPAALSSLL